MVLAFGWFLGYVMIVGLRDDCLVLDFVMVVQLCFNRLLSCVLVLLEKFIVWTFTLCFNLCRNHAVV